MHGVALNVNCDLRNFENIIPCGIKQGDRGVCSIQNLHDTLAGHLSGESFAFEEPEMIAPAEKVNIDKVASKWVQSFGEVFNVDLEIAGKSVSSSQSTASNLDGMANYHEEAMHELTTLVGEYPNIANLQVDYYTEPVDL